MKNLIRNFFGRKPVVEVTKIEAPLTRPHIDGIPWRGNIWRYMSSPEGGSGKSGRPGNGKYDPVVAYVNQCYTDGRLSEKDKADLIECVTTDVLSASSENIRRFCGDSYCKVGHFAKEVPELTKDVMKKIYGVFNIDSAREYGLASHVGLNGIEPTIEHCYSRISELGKALGLNEKQTWQVVGETPEEISNIMKKLRQKRKDQEWSKHIIDNAVFNVTCG